MSIKRLSVRNQIMQGFVYIRTELIAGIISGGTCPVCLSVHFGIHRKQPPLPHFITALLPSNEPHAPSILDAARITDIKKNKWPDILNGFLRSPYYYLYSHFSYPPQRNQFICANWFFFSLSLSPPAVVVCCFLNKQTRGVKVKARYNASIEIIFSRPIKHTHAEGILCVSTRQTIGRIWVETNSYNTNISLFAPRRRNSILYNNTALHTKAE